MRVCLYTIVPWLGATVRNMPPLAFGIQMSNTVKNRWIIISGLVGVNDSITVSSAWELTSVSMHYSQGNGVHTPLSRLVLYPRSVCVCVIEVYKCYTGLPSARLCAV